jgi:hypothetical protein
MERSFRTRGLTVLSTPIITPPNETTFGVSAVNRHIVPVMVQELKWAFGKATFPSESLIDAYDVGRWNDPQLPRAIRSSSYERAIERRGELERYFARIADATVVFIELAFADLWFDRVTGLAVMGDTSPIPLNRDPNRFEYHVNRYDDVRAALLELRATIAECSGADRIVLTLGAMPLVTTYRSPDLEADSLYQKSILRAVAGDLAEEFADVAYSPAYERVMNRPPTEIFKEDGVHVRDDVVEEAMAWLLRSFGIDRPATEEDFDERSYLQANSDVAALVRSGAIASGYHHWIREGRAAGRPLVARDQKSDEPIEAAEMRVRIAATLPPHFYAGEQADIEATVANRGNATYGSLGTYPVFFCYRWYDEAGAIVELGHFGHTSFARALGPGEATTVVTSVHAPLSPGSYTLSFTLLQHDVAWFDAAHPANAFRSDVVVEPRPAYVLPAADPGSSALIV